jgi:hypothetical protein
MSDRPILKSMIVRLSGSLTLCGCVATKSAEESPRRRGRTPMPRKPC